MKQLLQMDRALIAKYDRSGPRYTSYPTAVQFSTTFGKDAYSKVARESQQSDKPLSLYFHIPFCDSICFYCACNKVATKDHRKGGEYLERLYREIAMQAALVGGDRPVEQLHWGGGTPTFLAGEEMRDLMRVTGEHFNLLDNDQGQYSIEIDPRKADADTIALLREIGFNRISLGVQDYDHQVQLAVNRVQSEAETMVVLNAAREQGFKSVSIDLIYGLPKQTLASFQNTLERVIEASPDRLSIFNYAHLPTRFKPQRRIDEQQLPSVEEKLDILQMTAGILADAGYLYIGMDHFAKPDDELAVAQREGTLHRNFQGYSTHAGADLVGLGVSAIGKVGSSYAQNSVNLEEYYRHIDAGELAVEKGILLDHDDRLRRDVITRLICNFELDFAAVNQRWDIDFIDYFSTELAALGEMAGDGLLSVNDQGIEVASPGRLLIRNICQVFDAYQKPAGEQRFSRMI